VNSELLFWDRNTATDVRKQQRLRRPSFLTRTIAIPGDPAIRCRYSGSGG